MAATGYILPLASIDQVRADLADTEQHLNRLLLNGIVNRERYIERRDTLTWWRDRLASQLEQMEVDACC